MLHSGSSQRAALLTRAHLAAMLVAVTAFVVDQATKPLAHAYVEQNGPLQITSFLTMTAGWNTGVAFGVAALAHPSVLIAVGLGLSAVLAVFLAKTDSTFEKIALGMAIGGALANVLDRARFGAVRDFIDFHVNDWHWPAFNFADVFIVVGLFSLLFAGREQRRPATERRPHNGGEPR